MANDYKDLDYKDLNYKEIQLLTLQELRSINDKINRLDKDLTKVTQELTEVPLMKMKLESMDSSLKERISEIESLKQFKTQVTTAIVVINIIWGIIITLFKFLVG